MEWQRLKQNEKKDGNTVLKKKEIVDVVTLIKKHQTISRWNVFVVDLYILSP